MDGKHDGYSAQGPIQKPTTTPDAGTTAVRPTAAPGAKDGASEAKLVPEAMFCPSCGEAIFRMDWKAFGCRKCGAGEVPGPAPGADKVASGPLSIPVCPSCGSEAGWDLSGDPVTLKCGECGFRSSPAFTEWWIRASRIPARVSLPPVEVRPLPHLVEALSEVTSDGEANARLRPNEPLPPGFRSMMLEMIGDGDAGRCMACGWPVAESAEKGCVPGNCSFRPSPHDGNVYSRWKSRTQILVLARKYLAGELKPASALPEGGLPTAADLDAVAAEKKLEDERGR
jgi:hypothetical protein